MAPVGRPRKKDRLPPRPYNLSIDTADRLDKLKRKGETQDGVVKRILIEKEDISTLRTDLKNMIYLREDALKTVRELRELKAVLEIKLNESQRQVEDMIRTITFGEYTGLPWVF